MTTCNRRPLPITSALAVLALVLSMAADARAAGVVGTGTAASCTDAALNAALIGGGLVTFNCGAGPVTITVASTKVLTLSTTIEGGAGEITLSGGNAVRILQNVSGTLTLNHLTLANGNAGAGAGGAIESLAPMVVDNSTFTGNTSANTTGGGAIMTRAGVVTITNSTFTGNSATVGSGGAIYEAGGEVRLRNVTISGNTAAGTAGAFFDDNDNSEAFNTIIANNTPDNCGGDPFPNPSRFNLISDNSCGSNMVGDPGNLIDTNPLLAGLAGNGGPTRTMALNSGSPAINAGSPNAIGDDACASTDQRGVLRALGGRCDMGAFEVTGALPPPPPSGAAVPTLSEWMLIVLATFLGLGAVLRLR